MSSSKQSTVLLLLPPLLLFLAFQNCPFSHAANKSAVPVNVGLILDFESQVGKICNSSLSLALEDFYATHNHTKRLVFQARDCKRDDDVQAASAAIDLLENLEVEAILGPQTSQSAEFVANLGSETQVPIISFTATSPSLSSTKTPYFIRTAQTDAAQIEAIVAVIKTCQWRQVVPVYEDSAFGAGPIPFLTDALQQIGVAVPNRTLIPSASNGDVIGKKLDELGRMETRVFVVHMTHILAAQFFQKVNEKKMMSEGYVWIITNSIGDMLEFMKASDIAHMRGAVGVKTYIPQSNQLKEFTGKWRQRFRSDNPGDEPPKELNKFAIWAHDTVVALASAVEKVAGAGRSGFIPNGGGNSTTYLQKLGTSRSGSELLHAVQGSKFRGLGGEFQLKNGELQFEGFKIINVVEGDPIKAIGFWKQGFGLSVQDSKVKNKQENRTNLDAVRVVQRVTWPGGSREVPKGWAIPKGKTLKIGVPVVPELKQFVDVKSEGTNGRGFYIDVFRAVVTSLNYSIAYVFSPFQDHNGSMKGTYDELVYQVYLQKYDAVVGDTTIIANRSKYVDFTLPYLESGVSMIVPVQPRDDNAWVFLKPMSLPLCLTTGAFFVLTGIVVWILEHGNCASEFQGPPSEQTGKVFYFIFSTLVFAQKEKLVSNLSRVVVIVWVFVVLILTSSYTASLTSMLTAQQLGPSITDLQTLIRNKNMIGYRNGSFVVHLLKRLNVGDSRTKPFDKTMDVADALSRGDKEPGGIAAFFDEIPYNKIFLQKYCGKFTMVGPVYKNAGIGFVFPRGSPLVSDISRAILNVREGEQMEKMEQKWGINNKTECANNENEKISSSLSLSSFWGLFLITGTASVGALIIGTFSILHQYNKREGTSPSVDSEFKNRWQKLLDLVRYFDKKDLTSLAFKNKVMTVDGNQTDDAATSEYQLQSPISIDVQFVPYEDANFTDQDECSVHSHLHTRENAHGND